MKILIHSNGPHVFSGYGVQTNLLCRQLKSLGHDVAVSCLSGLSGQPIEWNDITLFPSGQADFGADVVVGHAHTYGADLLLTLMDFRKLGNIAHVLKDQKFKTAVWVPIDTDDKLGMPDRLALNGAQAIPIAMSKHGLKLLKEANFPDAEYAPHSVDLDVFQPAEDWATVRKEVGVDGKFVIGLNAANSDAARKSFPEQLMAFAQFHARHKNSLLFLHTLMSTARGYNLYELVEDLGLRDAVMMSDQYAYTAGLMPPEAMAAWYQSLNVLTNCSMGEGFGIPILEAQATGTPVVVTRASAMPELCGAGWTVGGEPFWNPTHRALWQRPNIKQIAAAYEKAYRHAKDLREDAAAFAIPYDYRTVANTHWKPILERIEGDL